MNKSSSLRACLTLLFVGTVSIGILSVPRVHAQENLESIERDIISTRKNLSATNHPLYKRARSFYDNQQYDDALRVLDELLAEDPGNHYAEELQNLCLIRRDLRQNRQSKKERHKKVRLMMKEAEAAYHDREYQKSIDIYDSLKDIEPKRTDKFNELIHRSEKEKVKYWTERLDDKIDVKTDSILKKVKEAYVGPTIGPLDSSALDPAISTKTEDQIRKEELRRKANEVIPVVDFNDAQIKDVLKYLSKISGVNIVIDDQALSATDPVTMYLKDATLLEILETILRAKGLVYQLQENMIWVTSKAQLRREEVLVKAYDVQDLVGRLYNFPARALVSSTGDEDDEDEEIEEED